MSEPDLAKLSEASELCGIPTLKMMAADGLLPQVVRGKAGHVYFPATTSRPGVSASACSRSSATGIFVARLLRYAAWTPNWKRSATTSPRPASTRSRPWVLL